MRVQYLNKLLIYIGQHFNTIPFILLACIILPYFQPAEYLWWSFFEKIINGF